MPETISQVKSEYIFAKEDSYGSIPGSPTELDIGEVQEISWEEDEQTEEGRAIDSTHTASTLDDGIYSVTGSITTILSHPAVENVFEAILGDLQADTPTTGEYTLNTKPVKSSDLSYFMKVNNTSGKTMQLTGIHATGGSVSISRDGNTEVTINYRAKSIDRATEDISPSTSVGDRFKGLDASVTYGGNSTILDEISFEIEWNVDEADMRGIESVANGERRKIQRVIRNYLTLSGSLTSHLDENIDTGYVDDRSTTEIKLTISRGSSNEHVFTIAEAKTNTRSQAKNTEDEKQTIEADFMGKDLTITGDQYS